MARMNLRVAWPVKLALVAVAGMLGAVGCAGNPSFDYHWETFEVKTSVLPEQREKLARAVQEVLIHRGFFPTGQENMQAVGAEGKLETSWNDEEARLPQGSFQGHRYKVSVRLVEGAEHLKQTPKDPIAARYYEDATANRPGYVRLALGLGCAQELNHNMNYRPGDFQNADWRPAGQAPQFAVRLMAEIRRQFYGGDGKDPDNEGYGSHLGRRIMEVGGDYNADDDKPNGNIGPGNVSGGTAYDFGTGEKP